MRLVAFYILASVCPAWPCSRFIASKRRNWFRGRACFSIGAGAGDAKHAQYIASAELRRLQCIKGTFQQIVILPRIHSYIHLSIPTVEGEVASRSCRFQGF